MSKLFGKGASYLHLTAYFLLGLALAGPVRLSFYFYTKPFWDLLIDGLLVAAAVVLALRWVQDRGKYLIVLIPFLALSWMRVEFILFSKAEIYVVFSYLFIALWGMGFGATWKFFDTNTNKVTKTLLSILMLMGGLVLGQFGWSYPLVPVASVLFLVSLLISVLESGQNGKKSNFVSLAVLMTALFLVINSLLPTPRFYESQSKFHDKVVYSYTTPFQRLDITEWKGNHWFYQDGINQFSSIDSWLYFEPFAHPAMQLVEEGGRVLIIGGENGMLARELLKYKEVSVDLTVVDREYLRLSRSLSYLSEQRGEIFDEPKLNVLEGNVFQVLNRASEVYDAIFVDVPDPIDIELNQYFSKEFYELCHEALKDRGLLVTQSGSPYFATTAFQSIQKTIQAADFRVEAYHNQVLTLGEWAWTIGIKSESELDLKAAMKALDFKTVETRWINNEAMRMMLSFGKSYVTSGDVKINTIKEPVIYKYYNSGNYQLQ
ncbi:MAG: hypothetical protein HEP71_08710 [Roseivirga sp.]|nr:hypothetical protein [Roseivirga sp.]